MSFKSFVVVNEDEGTEESCDTIDMARERLTRLVEFGFIASMYIVKNYLTQS